MGYGRMGNTAPRKARVSVASVAAAGMTNWEATEDVDGNAIPARIRVTDVIVQPTASTIRAIRMFGKSGRVNDPTDADHSLIYEDNWSDYTEASDEQTADRTPWTYIDESCSDERQATIYGSVSVKTAANASAFLIDIYFTERG